MCGCVCVCVRVSVVEQLSSAFSELLKVAKTQDLIPLK